MVTKTLISLATIIVLSAVFAVAATKPNFGGAWTMDRARSFGIPANMTQTMTVSQTENKIEVETKLIQPGNERSVKDSYTLDGKEYDFTPPVPPNAPAGQPAPKGKRTATWMPGDKGITVTDVTTAETPKGPVTTQIVRKWTISADGELVIDMYIDGPNGSFEAKRIFKKG